MKPQGICLKPSRERSVENRHPWIFSGALEPKSLPKTACPVIVESSTGKKLAHALFNPKASISARVFSYDIEKTPEEAWRENLTHAFEWRSKLFANSSDTNCQRLVNAEGDNLPSLIIDMYAGHVVFQLGTVGAELMHEYTLDFLKNQQLFPMSSCLERSEASSREEEGLKKITRQIIGETPKEIQVVEDGMQYLVDPWQGQKTGLFLDQREMRKAVGEAVRTFKIQKLLNCFSYQGGFSLQAVRAGCKKVVSVDVSEAALQLCHKLVVLNEQPKANHEITKADVFEFLRDNQESYDGIILDPPAFAKRRDHVVQACRGYKDINREAIKRMRPSGLLWTFSCSHFVDEKLFKQVVFQAAAEAGRNVQVLSHMQHAYDHPVSIYHPEGAYLKGLLLRVI